MYSEALALATLELKSLGVYRHYAKHVREYKLLYESTNRFPKALCIFVLLKNVLVYRYFNNHDMSSVSTLQMYSMWKVGPNSFQHVLHDEDGLHIT